MLWVSSVLNLTLHTFEYGRAPLIMGLKQMSQQILGTYSYYLELIILFLK